MPFGERWRLGKLALAALLAAAPLYAQNMVRAIQVQPPPGRSAAEFRALVRQPLDQPLDPTAIQQSLRALYATGEFQNIQVLSYPGGSGVRLVFATQPNFFVATIAVAGSPDPPAANELRDASGLVVGEPYTTQAVAAAAQRIHRRLQTYGYYQALVIPQAQLDPATAQAAVAFALRPGPLARAGSIEFTGDPFLDPLQLLQASHLRPGIALPRERVEDALTRLQAFYASRGHWDATIELQPPVFVASENRLNLDFRITAGPVVTVTALGFKLSRSVLRAQVPIFQEHAADLALVEEGRDNLQNYLQRQGYFEAQVTVDRNSNGSGSSARVDIVYHIQPGPRESLDAVGFAGNQYFDSEDLAERVQVRAASAWGGLLGDSHGRYSSQLAAADADAIARLYRNNGFAAVTVSPLVQDNYRGRPHHLAVIYQITEGVQTRVRKLTIAGADARQRTDLQALLLTAPGQPFAVASAAADRGTILTYFYNAGFQQARCTVHTAAADPPARSVDPAATEGEPTIGRRLGRSPEQKQAVPAPLQEDVTFTVTPGPQQTIHRLLIAGNQHVHTNVIRHMLAAAPGQPLSQLALLDSQRALYDSGLFTSAQVVARNSAGSEPAKDIFVTVHEAERYTFSEGVGIQVQGGTGGAAQDVLGKTGYSPLLSFDVTRTAMTGRNQTLALKSTYSTLQKRAVLSYDMPNFLNHSRWTTELNAFYDDTFDVRTFRAIREQGGIQLDQALTPYAGWSYDLNYRRVRVLSPQVAPQQIPVLSQPVEVAEAAATYHRDHRDDPINTHSGSFNSLQVALAKSYGDGFADFTRLDFQNHTYYPLGAHGTIVLARSTRFGVEVPFGPKTQISYTNPVTGASTSSFGFLLPLPERFLSGGSDSLRGFSINQAGPRDPITGFPVGGEALLVNNIELRFPVAGSTVGGVLFYDLGNVYSTPQEMVQALARIHPASSGAGDFTSHTVGFGLRYNTPVGPVRVDFGFLLNPPTIHYFSTSTPATALTQRLPAFHFFFSFGQTF